MEEDGKPICGLVVCGVRKVTVRVRNDTGKIPFGHGASLVRWGSHC